MGGETNGKFCIVCGVEEENDEGQFFSEEVKFRKFCGELELSSDGLSLNGEGEFKAFKFLEQLNKCSELVKVCEICSGLISEAVDKRGRLEEVECQVLELQIKLLVKLQELEYCSKLYLGEMGRIREKVKGSELNGLERSMFGSGMGKCDVMGFRERILNVVTSLVMFQDNLQDKLIQDRDPLPEIPEENTKQLVESPKDQESFNDFDNLSLSSPPPPSPDFDDDLSDNHGGLTLDEIKMETDNLTKPNEPTEKRPPSQDNRPPPKKPRMNKKKLDRRNRQHFSQVKWDEMGPVKSKLVETILKGYHADNPFKQYQWTYSVSTDQVQFAGYPIQINELEKDGIRTTTLGCTSCDHGGQDGFEASIKFPTDVKHAILLYNIRTGVDTLKRKIFDHVLSLHLNAFTCSKCEPEEAKKIKLTTRRQFQDHQKLHNEPVSNVCEICGKAFAIKKKLRRHLDMHLMRQKPEEADHLKRFQCATCGKKFYQVVNLRNHEDQHKPKEERAKVTCSFCGKEVLKRSYSNHQKYSCSQQSKSLKMDCEICGKTYKNEKSLGDHLVRTHKLAERPSFK